MLDLNQIRADFAAHLGTHAGNRHSLDAALMHVVEAAYQQGIEDALSVPAVLRDPIPDLDPGIPPPVRSDFRPAPAAGGAARIPGRAPGGQAGGGAEGVDAAAACATPMSSLYGCLGGFDVPEDRDL